MSPWLALYKLARPRLLPFVLLLVSVGFVWAHWDRALPLTGAGAFVRVCVAWVGLHAATLWLNAVFDQDEGPVLFGEVVSPPPETPRVARGVLVSAVLLAATAGWLAGASALGCALMAEAYSNPRTAWKAHPIGGPAVNLVGYGLLTPLAGWSVVGVSYNARTASMGVAMWLGVAGCYLVAQAFQEAEDRARGYRTFVAVYGAPATLDAARAVFAAGYVWCSLVSLVGWLPWVCLLAVPTAWWVDAALVQWKGVLGEPGGERMAAKVTLRLLVSACLVGGLLGVDYVVDSLAGGPVAGLSTPSGRP